MSQQININCPPRIPTVPQVPVPQTCYGVLEHTGIPYADQEMITDIPPSFDWMMAMQLYKGVFEVKNTDNMNRQIHNFHVLSNQYSDTVLGTSTQTDWHTLPFCSAKWWTGVVSWKFLAIKPPRVTGKLLIRYSFAPVNLGSIGFPDSLRREVSKEWDLGQSNVCEFDITAINPIAARPTWLPIIEPEVNVDGEKEEFVVAAQRLAYSSYGMGTISIEVAQRLQVGSIFPDNIRILKFRSFKNTKFMQMCDCRSDLKHCLTYANPSVKLNKTKL